jgi:hypothetical protein
MKRSNRIFFISILLIFGFGMISCSSQQTEADFATKVSAIHDKVLTVDTHADTPSRLLREDWKIGERHESTGRRSSKIDLPRMAEVCVTSHCAIQETMIFAIHPRIWGGNIMRVLSRVIEVSERT